jgi:hypothetical protein
MPSVSAGFLVNHVGIKAQYFPSNFFNPEYEKDGVRPFAGMKAQILAVSITYDFKSSLRMRPNRKIINMESSASFEQ